MALPSEFEPNNLIKWLAIPFATKCAVCSQLHGEPLRRQFINFCIPAVARTFCSASRE